MKKIFISYSDLDRSRMRSLEKIITKTSHFKPIIIADRRDALISFSDKVKGGIFECDYFIPILTKNSITSQWVNQEIGYATAQNKTILPIVEKDIIESLKGFIHKNIDLPYNFVESATNPKTTRSVYRKVSQLFINDLLIKNNFNTTDLELANIFPGMWQSEFEGAGLKGNDMDIEIRDGYKYFTNNKHWFNIDKFKYDSKRNRITFTKVAVNPNDTRRINCELSVLKLGQVYKGTAIEEVKKQKIEITYTRVV